YRWTSDTDSSLLGAVQLSPGSWERRVSDLGVYVFLPVIFLSVGLTLISLFRSYPESNRSCKGPRQLVCGTAVTSVGMIICLHALAHVDYPFSRYCLFVPFVFTLSALIVFDEIRNRFKPQLTTIAGLIVAALLIADYVAPLNVSFFRYNAYD